MSVRRKNNGTWGVNPTIATSDMSEGETISVSVVFFFINLIIILCAQINFLVELTANFVGQTGQ